LSAAHSHASSAAAELKEGLERMEAGEYLPAATNFMAAAELAAGQEREPAIAWFNAGNARYRAGDYSAARESYRQALAAEDLELQARAHYNIGNCELQMAAAAMDENEAELTVNLLEQAARSFEKAIVLDSDYADPKFNYELSGQRKYQLLLKVDELRNDIEKARRLARKADYAAAAALLQERTGAHALAFKLEPELQKRYQDLQQKIGQILGIVQKLEGDGDAV
jgi:tetratricopeptide (TPR) repeat protein